MSNKNLRQKTFGIFIRPYIEYGGDKLVYRSRVFALHPCQDSSAKCPSYIELKQGETFMLYKTTTSFTIAREIVKDIMDNLGYSINDIDIVEIIPKNHMITPIA